jgi:recombinational DNA repair protein (RecF pathway)
VPAQSLATAGFVLLKRPPSDAFQSLTVFSVEHGGLLVFQRLPRKSAPATTALDLFDEAELMLESSTQGRTWFVKEARLLTRQGGIGRSYETLERACLLAALIARNPVHEESRPAVAALLREAFTAFASGPRPDVIYFKSLYRFARDEGYPLKQEWFPMLAAADRDEVAALLNRPLAGQTATPASVTRLLRRLEDYLRGHTEILLD